MADNGKELGRVLYIHPFVIRKLFYNRPSDILHITDITSYWPHIDSIWLFDCVINLCNDWWMSSWSVGGDRCPEACVRSEDGERGPSVGILVSSCSPLGCWHPNMNLSLFVLPQPRGSRHPGDERIQSGKTSCRTTFLENDPVFYQ